MEISILLFFTVSLADMLYTKLARTAVGIEYWRIYGNALKLLPNKG
jgi:hypothetical protein